MSIDAVRQAMTYVLDGWPETEAADRFGVDVDELRVALRERDRAQDDARSGQRDTWDAPPDQPDLGQPRARATVGKRPKGQEMSNVNATPIDWLWPGYLARGKVHMLDGDPGLGKSTVTLDLAARVSRGTPWPDGKPGCEPAAVVLLTAEDGLADVVRPRLDLAGADVRMVKALTDITAPVRMKNLDGAETVSMEDRPPVLPLDIEQVQEYVEEHKAGLVIIDPLMAYLGADVNSYRDQDVRRAMAALARMAEQTDAAVILVRHLNKSNGGKALYRGGGSIGIIGASRLGLLIAADPNDPDRRILAVSKSNIAVLPPSLAYTLDGDSDSGCARIVWEAKPVEYTADELLADPTETEELTERDAAVEWLLAYLGDAGEAAAGDVKKAAREVGYSDSTLTRARKRARVTPHRIGFGKGSRVVWRRNP